MLELEAIDVCHSGICSIACVGKLIQSFLFNLDTTHTTMQTFCRLTNVDTTHHTAPRSVSTYILETHHISELELASIFLRTTLSCAYLQIT